MPSRGRSREPAHRGVRPGGDLPRRPRKPRSPRAKPPLRASCSSARCGCGRSSRTPSLVRRPHEAGARPDALRARRHRGRSDAVPRGLRRHQPAAGARDAAAQADELRDRLAGVASLDDGWASSLTAAELRLLPLLTTHLTFGRSPSASMSRNTVKTQAISVYRKLDASSRSEAIERALELGLVDAPSPPARVSPRWMMLRRRRHGMRSGHAGLPGHAAQARRP